MSQRLAQHVCSYKRWLNGKTHFVTSFKIIEQGNYDIVLIEKYPCNSKEELHARESYYSQTIPCVNKIKQQGLFMKLGQAEYDKKYYEVNKEKIIKQNKQYYVSNKAQIDKQRKQYYKANKEQIIEQHKQYYKANKEQIKINKDEKHNCDCSGCYSTSNKAQHFKTAKHIQWSKNQ